MQGSSTDADVEHWLDRFPFASSHLLCELCENLHTAIEDGVRIASNKIINKRKDGFELEDTDVITTIIEQITVSCQASFQSKQIRETRKMAVEFAEEDGAYIVQPYNALIRLLIRGSLLNRKYHKQAQFICETLYDHYHDIIYSTYRSNVEIIVHESHSLYAAIKTLTNFIGHSCLEVEINSSDLVKRTSDLDKIDVNARSSIESSAASTSRTSMSENRSSPITEPSLPDSDLTHHPTRSKEVHISSKENLTSGRAFTNLVVISDSDEERISVSDTEILLPNDLDIDAESPMEDRESINGVIESMEKHALEDQSNKASKGKSKARDDDDYDFLNEPLKDIDNDSNDSDYVEPKAGKKRIKRYRKAIARIRKVPEYDLGESDLTVPPLEFEQIIQRAFSIMKSKIQECSPPIQELLQTRSRENILEQVKHGMLTGTMGLLDVFVNGYLVSMKDLQLLSSIFPENDLPVVMISLANWDRSFSNVGGHSLIEQECYANAALISSTTQPNRSIFALKEKFLPDDVAPSLRGKCLDGSSLAQVALWQAPPFERTTEQSWRTEQFFIPGQDGISLKSAEDIRDALTTIVENIFISSFWLFQSDSNINKLSRILFPRQKPVIGLNDDFKKEPFNKEKEEVYINRRKRTRLQSGSIATKNRS